MNIRQFSKEKYNFFKFLAMISLGMMASLILYNSQDIDEFLIYLDGKQLVSIPGRMNVELSMISDYVSVLHDIYDKQQSILSEEKETDLLSLKNQYYLPMMGINTGFHTFWQENAKLGNFGLDMNSDDYSLKLCNELFHDFTNNIDLNTTKDEYKKYLSGISLILQLYDHLVVLINAEYDMQELKHSYRFLEHMNKSMAFHLFVKSNGYVLYPILAMIILLSIIIVFLGSYADEKTVEIKRPDYRGYRGTYKKVPKKGL